MGVFEGFGVMHASIPLCCLHRSHLGLFWLPFCFCGMFSLYTVMMAALGRCTNFVDWFNFFQLVFGCCMLCALYW